MVHKTNWDKLIKEIEDASKDPEFVKAAKHFVKITSNSEARS